MSKPTLCSCDSQDKAASCRRAGVPMTGRLWDICRGVNCPGWKSEAYRRRWDKLPLTVIADPLPCTHRGQQIAERSCAACGGSVMVPVYSCPKHITCTIDRKLPGLTCCKHCDDRESGGFVSKTTDPKCGLVIGSCGYPGLIELQIKVLRRLCGPVPVLISDDTVDEGKVARLRGIAASNPDVILWRNAEPLGHAPGDIAALFKAIQWAEARGIRVIAKLSNRFLPTAARWLQDGATDLLTSGKPFASAPCLQNHIRFEFRSEAALYDVMQWNRADVLSALEPSALKTVGFWNPATKRGISAEKYIWDLAVKTWQDPMHRWAMLPEQRMSASDGFLWHCADNDGRYRSLAAEYGVELDPERIGDA